MKQKALSGVRLEQKKQPAATQRVRLFVPSKVYIPLPDDATLTVTEGDEVVRGQVLGVCESGHRLKSSVKGIFRGIAEKSDETGASAATLMIEVDKNYVMDADRRELARFSTEEYSKDEIMQAVCAADIIDEMDGVPLAEKLMRCAELADPLICADAVDDEPYLSSALGLLYTMRKEVARGMALAQRVAGRGQCAYFIYDGGTDRDLGGIHPIDGIKITRMRGTYPARQNMMGRARAKGGTPVFIGAGALVHLYRAVAFSEPHTTCFVTVGGDSVSAHENLEVPVGTLIEDILWFSGCNREIGSISLGGPMRTKGAVLAGVPVSVTARGIMVMAPGKRSRFDCAGCGRCIQVCPVGITPYLIYRLERFGVTGKMARLRPDACIGCGACGYVCPSGLDLLHYINKAAKHVTTTRQNEQKIDQMAGIDPPVHAGRGPNG